MEEQDSAFAAVFHVRSQVEKSLLPETLEDHSARAKPGRTKTGHVHHRQTEASRTPMQVQLEHWRDHWSKNFRRDPKMKEKHWFPAHLEEWLTRKTEQPASRQVGNRVG
jgi:hypothetical protein